MSSTSTLKETSPLTSPTQQARRHTSHASVKVVKLIILNLSVLTFTNILHLIKLCHLEFISFYISSRFVALSFILNCNYNFDKLPVKLSTFNSLKYKNTISHHTGVLFGITNYCSFFFFKAYKMRICW